MEIPTRKPLRPYFASGPCAKPAGWNLSILEGALLGRSHRSPLGLEKLKEILRRLRLVLEIPQDYEIALISGSATGAMETLLWNLLGERPVDVLSHDVFGDRWAGGALDQLKLEGRLIRSTFGSLPDVSQTKPDHDCVFVWNGSTSGVMYPNANWVKEEREGLVLCDAASAAFIMPLPWEKLDAVAFSFQKGIGGEAGIGAVLLGPRALIRLKNHKPSWPVPYLYRLHHKGGVNSSLFEGVPLNTISLLTVEDLLAALKWAEDLGGVHGLSRKAYSNFSLAHAWIEAHPHLDVCAIAREICSYSTLVFRIVHPVLASCSQEDAWQVVRRVAQRLAAETVAFDIVNHMLAESPSFRLWCGPTIEKEDLEALFPWFDLALHETLRDLS